MSADIERLATELAALSAGERAKVLQRAQALGRRAERIKLRLFGVTQRATVPWADLIGEDLYDSYGVPVVRVKDITLKDGNRAVEIMAYPKF